MTTLGKLSKGPSQIRLFVRFECEYYTEDSAYKVLPASCKYQNSGNASWKVGVTSNSKTRVIIYCRRNLSSDTLHAVYSVRLISAMRDTQQIFKQGHATFSGPTLETIEKFNLNIDDKILQNICYRRHTYLEVHITNMEPPAKDMSVKIYEDAFNTVDKAQLFSDTSPFQSDSVISFKDGKEVHVNKNLLSLDSDWWKDTFAKHKDRVHLLNVDYKQFLDFLSVIYPTAHPITVKNVETLSKFAHDFKMTELLKRCDIFLMANSSKFGKSNLLRLAQNYNLERLQAQCNEYKSLEDIKTIKNEFEYLFLDRRTKRMLLDKILEISPSNAPLPENRASSDVVTSKTRASQILDKLASLSSCHSDIVLVVGNAKIPAHKHLLSYFSEFFDKMFKSEFKESRENEITLKDVHYEEMVELLSVTYPSDFGINETNIATIVKLADRFVMPIILDRCKQTLKSSNKIKRALKLWLAQQYNSVSDLQMEFARKCNSIEDVKKLKDESEFELLDDNMRALLLDRIAR